MQYEVAARGSQYEQGGLSRPGERVEKPPPTHAPCRPDVVGPTNLFAYRKLIAMQPGIMKALKGKPSKARENLVRVA